MNQINQLNQKEEKKLTISGKVSKCLAKCEMLEHEKMEKLYNENRVRLLAMYTQYCDERADVDIRSYFPFIYHELIDRNVLNLNRIELYQFELYLRDLDCKVENMDDGHLEFYTGILYELLKMLLDEDIVSSKRIEVLTEEERCLNHNCEETQKKCKCGKDGEYEDYVMPICNVCNKKFCLCDNENEDIENQYIHYDVEDVLGEI